MGELSANFIEVSIHLINHPAFSLYTYIFIYVDIYAKRKIFTVYNYCFINTMGELGSDCSSHMISICCID